MRLLNNWTVKSKLTLLVTMFTLGFGLFALVAYDTLHKVKVNGPYYQRIALGKDLIADILPPPEYIVESYLLVLQLADATDRNEMESLIQHSVKLHRNYDSRHAFWQADTVLGDQQLLQPLLVASYEPAQAFFRIFDEQFLPAVRRGDYKTANILARGTLKRHYDRHRLVIDQVVQRAEAHNARIETEAREAITRRTWFLSLVALAIVGLIAIGLGTGLSRSIARSLGQTVSALSATSSEMAATVEQHERTAISQAAAVHETTTTMDELDASFNQTAEMVRTAADTAQHAVLMADSGLLTVSQTLDGMHSLKAKVGTVAEQISNLSEHTGQIGSITRVVGDLANQTNMLALNAAVEAARAGEHGKGFGVVAAEIRKLADESKKSAGRINALVEEIQKATDATVMATEEGTKTVDADIKLAEETAQAFNGIVTSSNTALEAAQQTLFAVPQQVAAVKQVLSAMEALNRGAKETAEGLGQTKESVDNLREAALRLKAMV